MQTSSGERKIPSKHFPISMHEFKKYTNDNCSWLFSHCQLFLAAYRNVSTDVHKFKTFVFGTIGLRSNFSLITIGGVVLPLKFYVENYMPCKQIFYAVLRKDFLLFRAVIAAPHVLQDRTLEGSQTDVSSADQLDQQDWLVPESVSTSGFLIHN